MQKIRLNKEKCRVLTLAPYSWTIKETPDLFDESEYLVRQAKQIRENHGVLKELPKKSYQGISISIALQEKLRCFHDRDEVS